MTKSLFSPAAGLIQDILLLSSVFLIVAAVGMLLSLKVWDHMDVRKRRKSLKGRAGLPNIQ